MMRALRLPLAAAVLFAAVLAAAPARAEYRAYELEVFDLYDCRINEREECRSARLTTALDPQQYLLTHGGPFHIGVMMLATWMCYGDTSFYKPVCPRPPPREPEFAEGDAVEIALEKHITEGWRGRVEVGYYQASVRSNVYGVRFPERRGVYARYYEKDLRGPTGGEAAGGGGEGGGEGAAGEAAAQAEQAGPQAAPGTDGPPALAGAGRTQPLGAPPP